MKALKLLIVEDEKLHAQLTRKVVELSGFKVTQVVDSCDKALESVSTNPPDFVLMDIVLHGELKGIEIAEKINDIRQIPIIYTTSYQKAAFKRQASVCNNSIIHSFMKKPVIIENLIGEVLDLYEKLLLKKREFYFNLKSSLWVKLGSAHHKNIKIEDIDYVECLGGAKCEIVTIDNKYEYNSTLSQFSNHIPHPVLERVHRKFIINLDKIVEVKDNFLQLYNDITIPLGKCYLKNIISRGYLLKTK